MKVIAVKINEYGNWEEYQKVSNHSVKVEVFMFRKKKAICVCVCVWVCEWNTYAYWISCNMAAGSDTAVTVTATTQFDIFGTSFNIYIFTLIPSPVSLHI